MPIFLSPPVLSAAGAGELDGALGRLGARGQQEDLVEALRGNAGQALPGRGADLDGETVIVDQAVLDLLDDRLANFRMAVAGVGHQHAEDQSSHMLPQRS